MVPLDLIFLLVHMDPRECFCSLDPIAPLHLISPPVLLVPDDPPPPDLVESLISLSTMIFDKGVSRLVFNSLCLSIQCTYPVQFIVPATPSKQNNNKADKNAKNEEKQV